MRYFYHFESSVIRLIITFGYYVCISLLCWYLVSVFCLFPFVLFCFVFFWYCFVFFVFFLGIATNQKRFQRFRFRTIWFVAYYKDLNYFLVFCYPLWYLLLFCCWIFGCELVDEYIWSIKKCWLLKYYRCMRYRFNLCMDVFAKSSFKGLH